MTQLVDLYKFEIFLISILHEILLQNGILVGLIEYKTEMRYLLPSQSILTHIVSGLC